MAAISLNHPAVESYIVYSAILALKLLAMALLTAFSRITRGVYANPEDAKMSKGKVKFDDQVVERVRRGHLNDLENIPAFWVLGALYLTTNPAAAWATLLFRAFTAGRVLHTIVYCVVPLPQPARAFAFFVPYLVNMYMGWQIVLYYITAL
uniref:Microsomal glutathione S-transferase 1 n=1 Tax=Pectinophora gossypiella TaxID=13191 RepID=A0A1E1WDS4_PECGO